MHSKVCMVHGYYELVEYVVYSRVKFALSMQKTKVHSLEHVCPNGGLQGRSAQWYVIGSHPVVPTSCALVTKDG